MNMPKRNESRDRRPAPGSFMVLVLRKAAVHGCWKAAQDENNISKSRVRPWSGCHCRTACEYLAMSIKNLERPDAAGPNEVTSALRRAQRRVSPAVRR